MWNQLNSRKWELKHNNVVLATVFDKPTGGFSVYVSHPKVFDETKKKIAIIANTYIEPTVEAAKAKAIELIKTQVAPWASAVVSFMEDRK